LSSLQYETNLDKIEGEAWLEVGNNATYGKTRAVVNFGTVTSAIPAGSTILDAELGLWKAHYEGSAAQLNAHALSKPLSSPRQPGRRPARRPRGPPPASGLRARA
jgi:hypothetical protein